MRMGLPARAPEPLFEPRFIAFAGSRFGLAPQRFARRWRPVLRLLVTLGVAVIGPFEIAKGDDEACPAVDEAALENVMLHECPQAMADGARHRHALAGKLRGSKRRIAIGLVEDLGEVAERELPDRVVQRADRFRGEKLITLVYRLERVAHAAFAEELRLAEIWIPAGAA